MPTLFLFIFNIFQHYIFLKALKVHFFWGGGGRGRGVWYNKII